MLEARRPKNHNFCVQCSAHVMVLLTIFTAIYIQTTLHIYEIINCTHTWILEAKNFSVTDCYRLVKSVCWIRWLLLTAYLRLTQIKLYGKHIMCRDACSGNLCSDKQNFNNLMNQSSPWSADSCLARSFSLLFGNV
jgi:hypothetical protein